MKKSLIFTISFLFVLLMQILIIFVYLPIIKVVIIGLGLLLVLSTISFCCSKNKKQIILSGVLLIVSLYCFVTNAIFLFNIAPTNSEVVVHAGGAVNKNTYLNCKEGFLASIVRGGGTLYSKNNYEQLCDIFSGEFWYTNYKSLYSPNFINYYFGDKPRVTTIVLNVNMWSIYKMHNFETNKKVAVHTINDSDNFNFIKNRKVDYIFTD